MKKSARRLAAFGLTAALAISAVTVPNEASAAKAVKKVTVNKKKVTLYPGADVNYGSIKIKAAVKPKGAKAKLKWKSNKKKVATVNSKGLIKAKKAGKATITVKAGKKSAKVKVTVKKIKKKVTKVTVASSSLTVNKNQSVSIKASVTPAKATLKKLTYKSSNAKVASVSAKGVVKGLQAGTSTITVRAVDGSKKQAKVTVTVTDGSTQPGTSGGATTNPSNAPSNQPSSAPSNQPSAAPSGQPSSAPSDQPSSAPSSQPSSAPSDQPSSAPSDQPSSQPSSAPSSQPSAEPSSQPSQAPDELDIPGNVKQTLDLKEEYHTKATVLGTEIDVKATGEEIADSIDQVMSQALKGFKELYKDEQTYMNKEFEPKKYTVTNDISVVISKDKGKKESWDNDPGTLKIKLTGLDDIDGEYQTKIYQDGDGVYNMSDSDINAKYYVEGTVYSEEDGWQGGNQFVIRFAESASETVGGEKIITYDIDELSLRIGDKSNGKTEVIAVGKTDKTDNITVTVTKAADGSETIKAVQKGKTIVIKKDAKGGYGISIPEGLKDKYGIQNVK